MWPERCLRITGRTARVTFIGPMRLAANCWYLPLGQFLEVASVEAGRVIDQHIDPTKVIDGDFHRRRGIGTARDVERYR